MRFEPRSPRVTCRFFTNCSAQNMWQSHSHFKLTHRIPSVPGERTKGYYQPRVNVGRPRTGIKGYSVPLIGNNAPLFVNFNTTYTKGVNNKLFLLVLYSYNVIRQNSLTYILWKKLESRTSKQGGKLKNQRAHYGDQKRRDTWHWCTTFARIEDIVVVGAFFLPKILWDPRSTVFYKGSWLND